MACVMIVHPIIILGVTLWLAGTRSQQALETSMACKQFASSSLIQHRSMRITPVFAWLASAGITQLFDLGRKRYDRGRGRIKEGRVDK